jgi:hypothetical protein
LDLHLQAELARMCDFYDRQNTVVSCFNAMNVRTMGVENLFITRSELMRMLDTQPKMARKKLKEIETELSRVIQDQNLDKTIRKQCYDALFGDLEILPKGQEENHTQAKQSGKEPVVLPLM